MAWNWLKQFLFSSIKKDTDDTDEENRIFKELHQNEEEIAVEKEIGVVTFVQNGSVEINNIWIAFEDRLSLKIGTLVTYCKPKNIESNIVTNVELMDYVSHHTKYEDANIYEGEICFVDDEKLLMNPGSLLIWRNDTEVTYFPENGDCIKLENCNGILRLRPQECKIVNEKLNVWNGKYGILGNNIKISLEVCENFYSPKVGDNIISSIIPCLGNGYQWRSLVAAKFDRKDFKHRKKIEVKNIPIFLVPAGKEKLIEIPVKNISFKALEIVFVEINPRLANVTLIDNPVRQIEPGIAIIYKILCSGTQLGWSNFELKFKFTSFVYYKHIKFLTAEDNPEQNLEQIDEITRGPFNFIDQYRKTNFLKIKPKNYEIPSYFLEICADQGNDTLDCISLIQDKIPELGRGLTMENFSLFFHTLLYLEELAQVQHMDKLETVAPLIRRGQYYIFAIDKATNYSNLCIGDTVQLSNPWFEKSESHTDLKICYRTESEIYLQFKDVLNIIGDRTSLFRLKFRNNRTCTIRTHHAIDYFLKHVDVKWLFPNGFNNNHNKEIQSNTHRFWNTSRKNEYFFKELNEQQKDAVDNIVFASDNYNYPYLIFGPPGTGKTLTLVETTLQTICQYPDCKILIAAPSNSAIDTFCLLLIGSGIVNNKEFLRLTSFNYAQQGQLPVNLVDYSAVSSNCEQETEIRMCEVTEVAKYKVVAGTLNTLAILNCIGLRSGHFTHIFIDEAGQTTEPETLIPLATIKPGSTRIVLAGDPHQLGPVILSRIAKQYHLGESLMMRLMSLPIYSRILKTKECSFKPKIASMLCKNYRSLSTLVDLTSSLFYNNELVATISEDSREAQLLNDIKKTMFGLRGSCLTIVNVNGNEEVLKGEGCSYWNSKEASRITIIVLDLFKIGITIQHIGIITPYSLQVKQIRQCFNLLKIEPPKIGTVEEFQGSERDIIIISLVRTTVNECGLSFISDPRRANVALSRAKVMNIIVSDITTLRKSHLWQQVLNRAELMT